MTHILYNGRARLEFDPLKHSYTVAWEGAEPVPIPSVTKVLDALNKPVLPRWAARETADYVGRTLKPGVGLNEIQIANLVKDAKAAPWRKSSDAADIGSLVHAYAEAYVLGQEPSMPIHPEAQACVRSFLRWIQLDNVVITHHAERKMLYMGLPHAYAGTCDLVATINGKLAIADFKTSTGIWPEYRLQLAAYRQAYGEETGEWADECWCLRFGKDGAFEAACYTDHDTDWQAFQACLEVHHWQQSVARKR